MEHTRSKLTATKQSNSKRAKLESRSMTDNSGICDLNETLKKELEAERKTVRQLRREKEHELQLLEKREQHKAQVALKDLRSQLHREHQRKIELLRDEFRQRHQAGVSRAVKMKDLDVQRLQQNLDRCKDELREAVEGGLSTGATRHSFDVEHGKLLQEIQELTTAKKKLTDALQLAAMSEKQKSEQLRQQQDEHRNELLRISRDADSEIKRLLDEIKTKKNKLAQTEKDHAAEKTALQKLLSDQSTAVDRKRHQRSRLTEQQHQHEVEQQPQPCHMTTSHDIDCQRLNDEVEALQKEKRELLTKLKLQEANMEQLQQRLEFSEKQSLMIEDLRAELKTSRCQNDDLQHTLDTLKEKEKQLELLLNQRKKSRYKIKSKMVRFLLPGESRPVSCGASGTTSGDEETSVEPSVITGQNSLEGTAASDSDSDWMDEGETEDLSTRCDLLLKQRLEQDKTIAELQLQLEQQNMENELSWLMEQEELKSVIESMKQKLSDQKSREKTLISKLTRLQEEKDDIEFRLLELQGNKLQTIPEEDELSLQLVPANNRYSSEMTQTVSSTNDIFTQTIDDVNKTSMTQDTQYATNVANSAALLHQSTQTVCNMQEGAANNANELVDKNRLLQDSICHLETMLNDSHSAQRTALSHNMSLTEKLEAMQAKCTNLEWKLQSAMHWIETITLCEVCKEALIQHLSELYEAKDVLTEVLGCPVIDSSLADAEDSVMTTSLTSNTTSEMDESGFISEHGRNSQLGVVNMQEDLDGCSDHYSIQTDCIDDLPSAEMSKLTSEKQTGKGTTRTNQLEEATRQFIIDGKRSNIEVTNAMHSEQYLRALTEECELEKDVMLEKMRQLELKIQELESDLEKLHSNEYEMKCELQRHRCLEADLNAELEQQRNDAACTKIRASESFDQLHMEKLLLQERIDDILEKMSSLESEKLAQKQKILEMRQIESRLDERASELQMALTVAENRIRDLERIHASLLDRIRSLEVDKADLCFEITELTASKDQYIATVDRLHYSLKAARDKLDENKDRIDELQLKLKKALEREDELMAMLTTLKEVKEINVERHNTKPVSQELKNATESNKLSLNQKNGNINKSSTVDVQKQEIRELLESLRCSKHKVPTALKKLCASVLCDSLSDPKFLSIMQSVLQPVGQEDAITPVSSHRSRKPRRKRNLPKTMDINHLAAVMNETARNDDVSDNSDSSLDDAPIAGEGPISDDGYFTLLRRQRSHTSNWSEFTVDESEIIPEAKLGQLSIDSDTRALSPDSRKQLIDNLVQHMPMSDVINTCEEYFWQIVENVPSTEDGLTGDVDQAKTREQATLEDMSLVLQLVDALSSAEGLPTERRTLFAQPAAIQSNQSESSSNVSHPPMLPLTCPPDDIHLRSILTSNESLVFPCDVNEAENSADEMSEIKDEDDGLNRPMTSTYQRRRLADVTESSREKDNLINTLKLKISELQRSTEEKEEECMTAKTKVHHLQGELENFTSQLQEKEQEVLVLRNQLEDQMAKVRTNRLAMSDIALQTSLMRSNKECQTNDDDQLCQLNDQLQRKESEIRAKSNEVDKLSREMRKWQKDALAADDQKREMLEQLRITQKKLNDIEKSHTEKIQAREKEIQTTNYELCHHKAQLEQTVEELAQQLKALENVATEKQELAEKLEDYESKNLNKDSPSSFAVKFSSDNESISDLQEKFDELTKVTSQAQGTISSLRAKIVRLARRCKAKDELLLRLTTEIRTISDASGLIAETDREIQNASDDYVRPLSPLTVIGLDKFDKTVENMKEGQSSVDIIERQGKQSQIPLRIGNQVFRTRKKNQAMMYNSNASSEHPEENEKYPGYSQKAGSPRLVSGLDYVDLIYRDDSSSKHCSSMTDSLADTVLDLNERRPMDESNIKQYEIKVPHFDIAMTRVLPMHEQQEGIMMDDVSMNQSHHSDVSGNSICNISQLPTGVLITDVTPNQIKEMPSLTSLPTSNCDDVNQNSLSLQSPESEHGLDSDGAEMDHTSGRKLTHKTSLKISLHQPSPGSSTVVLSSPDSIRQQLSRSESMSSKVQEMSSRNTIDFRYKYRATKSCEAEHFIRNDQISFRKDSIVRPLGQVDEQGFIEASVRGKIGLVHVSYIEPVSNCSTPSSPSGSSSLFPFNTSAASGSKFNKIPMPISSPVSGPKTPTYSSGRPDFSKKYKGRSSHIRSRQDSIKGIPNPPMDFRIERTVGANGILLCWSPDLNRYGRSNDVTVVGYKIFVSGVEVQRVDNAHRNKALLERLDLSSRTLYFGIQTVGERGELSELSTIYWGADHQTSDVYDSDASSVSVEYNDGFPATAEKRVFMAIYDYEPTKAASSSCTMQELAFKTGEVIITYGPPRPDGFFYAKIRERKGLVPSSFIEEVSLLHCRNPSFSLKSTYPRQYSNYYQPTSASESLRPVSIDLRSSAESAYALI